MDINLRDIMKLNRAVNIYPRDQYVYQLPNYFVTQKKVMVTERPVEAHWINSQIIDVHDGCIKLTNDNHYPVHLKNTSIQQISKRLGKLA